MNKNNVVTNQLFLCIFWSFVLLIHAGCCFRRKSLVNRESHEADIAYGSVQSQSVLAAELPNESVPHGHMVFPEQLHSSEDDVVELANKNLVPEICYSEKAVEQDALAVNTHAKHYVVALEDYMIKIDFENEDLTAMINHFAALQKKNIVFPQGAQMIKQKITFKLAQAIPLREVNKYLDMFLDLAGYSRVPHGAVDRIVLNDAAVTREPLPLYVGIDPKELPNSAERIRVIYYLKNLHVPENVVSSDPITTILTSILSANLTIAYDARSNAIIAADKSDTIRAAMALILELDDLGSKNVIRAMSLYNSTAAIVAELVTKQIMVTAGDIQAGIQTESGQYFSTSLRVVPDLRTNALIIMGREPAVERLQDFIREYIDVPLDIGASILHFYDLQYLDAEKFAPVLQAVVKEQQLLGSGQATQQVAGRATRLFQNVIVVPEKVVAERLEVGRLTGAGQGATSQKVLKDFVYRGGNRIIVTASREDWKRIEGLIKQLDQPQLQILVQVLIVDIDATNSKTLATQLRNPSWMQLPNGFAFQSAQLVQPILDGPLNPNPPPVYSNPTTVAADLLRLLSGNVSAATQIVNQPGNAGSMIVSFNDPSATTPGIWAFMQWLEKFFATKVLQHPYILVQNHERGEEYISDIRRVPGMASVGEGGSVAVSIEDVPAAVRIAVVPRASSIDQLNLKASITIDRFEGTGANRVTRTLETSVNLASGNILVVGGLTEFQELYTESQTPILGSVPILKWLFTNTQRRLRRSNLVVFISPTVIEPRLPDGSNAFTKSETHRNYKIMKQDELLSQLKEPISYLFFNDRNDNLADMLDQYMAIGKGDFVYDPTERIAHHSSHMCDPCKEEVESTMDICAAAVRIKRQFALEENPLLSTQLKNTPITMRLGGRRVNLCDYFEE
jgi:general secretion pathway protein D